MIMKIDDTTVEELRKYLQENLIKKEDIDDSSSDFLMSLGVSLLSSVVEGQVLSKTFNDTYGAHDDDIQMWLNEEKQKSVKFQTLLIKLLNAKGYEGKYPEFYKRADIDRRLFSRISSEANEQIPDKKTVFKVIVGLELSLQESETMLQTVGCCYNAHKKFDMIIKYCVSHEIYDPNVINDYLSEFGEKGLFFVE